MNCRNAQAAISAFMDGDVRERNSRVNEHIGACSSCRHFEAAAQRIRTGARLQIAEPVPDLVGQIMSRVREETAVSASDRGAARGRSRLLRPANQVRLVSVRAVVAAALAGALVGALAVSGGVVPWRRPAAVAAGVPQEIASAARRVSAYQATYRVTENGWLAQVPVRSFDVRVSFDAPESYRVDVADLTKYPAGKGQPNDSQLIVNGSGWSLRGPDSCVAAVTTICPSGATASNATFRKVVTGRPPFDSDSPMPTDIVLPITSLAGSNRVEVLGQGTIGGKPAVEVAMSAGDAAPLFAFFQQAGSWRPMYPGDQVTLWLDANSWFPLAYSVVSSGGWERAAWAASNGLPVEQAGRTILGVRLTSISFRSPPPSLFSVAPGNSLDEGFRDIPLSQFTKQFGRGPVSGEQLGGLSRYRAGYFADAPGEAIVSYADGLSWLTVRESRSWNGPSLFGAVDAYAELVALPGGGVAYYEPATDQFGRRLSIHSAGVDLFLESNLSRDALISAAASLPLRGLPEPQAWQTLHPAAGVTVRSLSPGGIEQEAGFDVFAPSPLPEGYSPAAALLTTAQGRGDGVPGTATTTLYYNRPGTEPAGFGIRIYQSAGVELPPASGTGVVQVPVAGTSGRWSPSDHELDWVDAGVYHSITAPELDLGQVVGIARSLRPGAA